MSCDRHLLDFGFGLCLYFFLIFFSNFFLFGCLFRECWNSFLLRLVPSHPRRASPRAHRVLRVLIERYSESSIVIAHWEARPFPLLPFTWVSAPAGRLSSIPIRMQLIPDCTRKLFSGWKIEDAFFLFVESSTAPLSHLILCLSLLSVSTRMAVSEVVCLSVYLSLVMGVTTLSCACASVPPNLSLTYRRAH